MFDSRRLTAAAIASTIVLSGSWIYSANAQPDSADSCARALDLAEDMAEINGHYIGTMGARSISLRLGDEEKVESLTPKLNALRAEYQSAHLEMREQAAVCR